MAGQIDRLAKFRKRRRLPFMRRALLCVVSAILLATFTLSAQQTNQPAHTEPAWLAGLTPEQKTLFESVNKDFSANDFKSALPKLRSLHQQLPQNDTLTKFSAEAAVNTGDYDFAASLLDPILRGNPDDPQALSIQAHCYGQQHLVEQRDAVLDHLQKLHDSGKPAPRNVIVESDALTDGTTVRIRDYIEPFSRFHIVLMAEFFDATGQRIRRTALESDDIDQVKFGKDHPEQAAAGVRIYSMDGYSESRNAQGQVTGQTHATLCPVPDCFMTGRPTYEFFRSIVVHPEKKVPASSTSTFPVSTSK